MAAKLWSKRLLVSVFLGTLGLFHILCPWQLGVVSGASMEPSFHSHQMILIDRGYYHAHPVRRGDVIILRLDDGVLIKRVYALGGDSFWTLFNTDDGVMYREIVEPQKLRRFQRLLRMLPTYRLARVTVPTGSVYVVGDNSTVSVDSRQFGPIPTSAILGRVHNAPPLASTPPVTTVARR